MEWLQSFISHFTGAFKWLYVLQPWEQALRVRAGRYITMHDGGIHFKIPYLDYIFKQNTRLRLSEVGVQTVTTLDQKTITLSGALSYRVRDITPLYQKLHQPEDTISRQVQAIISTFIATHKSEDCGPQALMDHVKDNLDVEQYGLADTKFILKDFASVKTYRFVTGNLENWAAHTLETD